jgi:response regulator NasT
MSHPLRIAVADDEPDVLEFYQVVLPEMGHELVCTARDGRELVKRCRQARPDLVIVDVKMPHLDGIEAVRELSADEPLPAIIISGYHDLATLRRAETEYILAYLVKPIREADLEAAICIAMRRYEQFQALRQEADSLRQALEDRKIIAHVTRTIMAEERLDEALAFERLKQRAAERGQTLAETARALAACRAAG